MPLIVKFQIIYPHPFIYFDETLPLYYTSFYDKIHYKNNNFLCIIKYNIRKEKN